MREHALVVESQPQTRQAICQLLGRAGIATRAATSISETLRKLDRIPSLVVLDLVLPDGSGVEVLEAIHAAAIPARVAVLSAGGDGPSVDWIAKYRPDAVFGKPLDFEDFVDWLAVFDAQPDESPHTAEIKPRRAARELAGSLS